jgi:nucleotide-binding universal stress UspA family protein
VRQPILEREGLEMYEKMMVTLDGSDLAEEALPCAKWLAEKLGSQVTLLSVVTDDKLVSIYQDYLDKMSEKVGEEIGAEVDTAVLTGKAGKEIVSYIRDNDIGLTVMSTHGRSGIGRWVLGSVADKVTRETYKPIIVIKAKEGGAVTAVKETCGRILVPLDGSREGEAALPYVAEIADKAGGEIVLLRVVERESHFVSAGEAFSQIPYTEEEMKPLREEVRRYLDEKAAGLNKRGINVSTERLEGDPAGEIMAFAEESGVDMVAMSTHGRSGFDRWTMGSVATKIVHAGCTKVMLVREKESD